MGQSCVHIPAWPLRTFLSLAVLYQYIEDNQSCFGDFKKSIRNTTQKVQRA